MKRVLFCGWLMLVVSFGLAGLVAAQGPGEAGLFIDAGDELGPISPYVYGANYGPLSQVTVDVLDEAIDSGVTFIRFPGGRWGDQNNLQSFQIDMFVRLCEQMGAEPSISVRLEGGTPEQAADLVRYANVEKGYGVRYWSIGNEPNLFDDYTTEDHAREWRAIAEAMLAVDPDIVLLGPDVSQYSGDPAIDPVDPEGRDWVREFLVANGDMVDIVTVHRYPFPRSMAEPVSTIDELRANTPEWDGILDALRQDIAETVGHDLPVAITEANSHWSASIQGEASPDSHFNAIWWADALGRLIRDQPAIVAYFELQTPVDRGGWGMLSRYEVRPSYYVYQLYQQFGTTLVTAMNHDDADVSIYAALRDDGALTAILVNLDDEAQTRPLTLDGFGPAGVVEQWLFDAEHTADQMDDLAFSSGDSITLPPQSVMLLVMAPEEVG